MPSVEKIIEKMKNQPNGIILQEIEKVLKAYGYNKDRQRGSHILYDNNGKKFGFAIHGKDTIKECYIKDILRKIDKEEG